MRTLALWQVLLIVAAMAAPASAASPARASSPARSPATAQTHPAVRRPARTSAVTPARSAADTSIRHRPRVAPRTLDDIHIEGEIPVPQILFVTARDQRRFLEFQHHRYQRSSLELGRATPTPSRVVVTAPAPAERKENQR